MPLLDHACLVVARSALMGHHPSYDSAGYLRYKKWLREYVVFCWVTDENGKCHRRAVTPDHYPPICTFRNTSEWRGEYLPICKYHSHKQAGQLAKREKFLAKPTRQW